MPFNYGEDTGFYVLGGWGLKRIFSFFCRRLTSSSQVLRQTGRISNDSVSTTYVTPCDSWVAYHQWWWDVYLKLICSLSLTHAVSKIATPLRRRNGENSESEKACCVKKETGQSSASSRSMSCMHLLYVGV